MAITKVLTGHTDESTAYLVSDYPYGRDRCRIRYWLESNNGKGYRFCSQTEHPRKLIWNAPKRSTYQMLAGAMYLDEKGHVQWTGLNEYSDATKVLEFVQNFPGAVTQFLWAWCLKKHVLSSKLASGDAYFTINGQRQERTEAETERNRQDAQKWKEAADACKAIVRRRTDGAVTEPREV